LCAIWGSGVALHQHSFMTAYCPNLARERNAPMSIFVFAKLFLIAACVWWFIILRRAYLFRLRSDILAFLGGVIGIPYLVMWAFFPGAPKVALGLSFVPSIIVLLFAYVSRSTYEAKMVKVLRRRLGGPRFDFALIHKSQAGRALEVIQDDLGQYHINWRRARFLTVLCWLPLSIILCAATWQLPFFVVGDLICSALLMVSLYPLSLTTDAN